LTEDEQENIECTSLWVKSWIQKSLDIYNKLPKYEIPKFATAMEAVWWLHNFLRKANPDEAEYVFLNMMQPWYFLKCGNFMLTESGDEVIKMVRNIVKGERSYGFQYCEFPKIKEQQGSEKDYTVVFYPKAGVSFSRIRVGTIKGELKVTDINLSNIKDKELLNEIANLPADVCRSAPEAFWRSYQLKGAFVGASFPSEPLQATDPENSKRFTLTANFGNCEWVLTGEVIGEQSKSSGGGIFGKIKSIAPKSDATSMSNDFRKEIGASSEKEGVWQARGSRGYDAVWKVNKGGTQVEMRYRAIIVKDMYYQMWVKGNAEPEDVSKFFESISINK
jgi:hypothetical protein